MSLFSNNNIFTNSNNNANKLLKSLGYFFGGMKVSEKNGDAIYGSIISTPEFSDLSLEELRLNDYTFAKTGLLPQQPIFLSKLENQNSIKNISNINNNNIFGNINNNTVLFGNKSIINQGNNHFSNNSLFFNNINYNNN